MSAAGETTEKTQVGRDEEVVGAAVIIEEKVTIGESAPGGAGTAENEPKVEEKVEPK